MSFLLNCVSAVINIMAKVGSLLLTISGNIDGASSSVSGKTSNMILD